MVAAVMAVVHMAACMAVPPPAWPPALPSRTFVLVLVLVLVLGDSAIGDANGALAVVVALAQLLQGAVMGQHICS